MDLYPRFKFNVCGIGELEGHCEAGISHVLSILDPDWPIPDAFGTFGEHVKLELRFHDVIDPHNPNVLAPQPEHVTEILTLGRSLLAEPGGTHLLVHCHAGISRSTASLALILAQAQPETRADQIFAEVLRIRPQAWPNLRILELGDDALSRRGELVAAAAGIYRLQLDRRQYLVEQMRTGGRGREVEAALS